MPYTKVHEAWEDLPSTNTPIDAASLDQIEAGIADAQADADSANTAAANHIADASAAHAATAVSFSPVGTVVAANVQDAIAELEAASASFQTPEELAADAAFTGTFAALAGAEFSGPLTVENNKVEIRYETFTPDFDVDLWVAGSPRTDPADGHLGIYAQTRVSGDMGGFVHAAITGELRISNASNTDFLIGIEATTVVTGGVNAINDQRGITVSSHFEGTPSGTITLYTGIAIQDQAALTGTLAVTTARGLWVDGQTRATNSYGVVIDKSSTQTLWVGADANYTDAAAGIAFGSSRDTTLYRAAAGTLRSPALRVGYDGSTQALWIDPDANSTVAAAGIAFGTSKDLVLYRSAAGTLTFPTLVLTFGLTVPNITMNDSGGIRSITAASNGVRLGAAASNKVALWGATPIVQPTTAVTAATFVANTSGIADDTATFDGYTIGKVVKALRNAGILA